MAHYSHIQQQKPSLNYIMNKNGFKTVVLFVAAVSC